MDESGFLTQSDGSAAIEPDVPHAFLQFKNTNICFDFHCECGAHLHFDGFFANLMKCPHCLAEWEMPCILFPRKRCAGTHPHTVQIMERDEDIDAATGPGAEEE